ncbi:MAG: MBL fold metallo-hydrolase [Proteobacteria bacterium]|nr:MBL fold metallo-hydrolase [Pseudomonadota bacterium]
MSHYHDAFETEGARVLRYCIGAFGVNTFILICRATKRAAVIDPGGDVGEIVEAIRAEGAVPEFMLFTHAHIDHMYGAKGIKKAFPDIKVAYHALEQQVVDAIPDQCRMFGVPCSEMPPCDVDLAQTPDFGVGQLQVYSLLTPGHTPGGVVFYLPLEKLVFTGDLLFKGSVGRTDFEGGSGTELRRSLDLMISHIPDEVTLLPGHGKYTTMGEEKKSNFYLRVDRWR